MRGRTVQEVSGNNRYVSDIIRKSIRGLPFAPFLPKVRTSFGVLCRRKTSFGPDFYSPCTINTTSTLPFCAKNNPSVRLVRTLGTIRTTLHLLITYIIIYMWSLGAKFGNTQQAEVRTSCTFLPSGATLRNISRTFYIHNSLLVRTSRTFLRYFYCRTMKMGCRNRFRSRSSHLVETLQGCRCEL